MINAIKRYILQFAKAEDPEKTRTIQFQWNGILRFHETKTTAGFLEGINSLIQAAKRKARGYRTTKNLITMIYLIAGKLDFQLTHLK